MPLHFGTAGIPISAKHSNTIDGIKHVRDLGLDAMELEFVQSVNITKEKAPLVMEAASESSVVLTCHAPYYINFNSLDRSKVEASKQRLLKAARIAALCGAGSVAFHPGFYHKMPAENVLENIRKELADVVSVLKSEGVKIRLRPETMGRVSQFGTLDETIKLAQEIDGVLPCIDFGHLRAREGANSHEEFSAVLADIEKSLGREALNDMHIHIEGIEFGASGEKRHLPLDESDLDYHSLINAWKDFSIRGVIISESPNLEKDALMLRKLYESL